QPDNAPGFRGMISVDVCNWYVPEPRERPYHAAWTMSRDEIAKEVWRQMTASLDERSRCKADPTCYHLDDHIELDEGLKPPHNRAPYLIARPEDWLFRPGDPKRTPEDPNAEYQIARGAWVIAGTYMRTFTRLTTMESANESARHAVNALLDKAGYTGPRCT